MMPKLRNLEPAPRHIKPSVPAAAPAPAPNLADHAEIIALRAELAALRDEVAQLRRENAELRQAGDAAALGLDVRRAVMGTDTSWRPADRLVYAALRAEAAAKRPTGQAVTVQKGISTLARQVGVSPNTATTAMQRLERAGLVTYRTNRTRTGPGKDDVVSETVITVPAAAPAVLPSLTRTEYQRKAVERAAAERQAVAEIRRKLDTLTCPSCGSVGDFDIVCRACGDEIGAGLPDHAEAGRELDAKIAAALAEGGGGAQSLRTGQAAGEGGEVRKIEALLLREPVLGTGQTQSHCGRGSQSLRTSGEVSHA